MLERFDTRIDACRASGRSMLRPYGVSSVSDVSGVRGVSGVCGLYGIFFVCVALMFFAATAVAQDDENHCAGLTGAQLRVCNDMVTGPGGLNQSRKALIDKYSLKEDNEDDGSFAAPQPPPLTPQATPRVTAPSFAPPPAPPAVEQEQPLKPRAAPPRIHY